VNAALWKPIAAIPILWLLFFYGATASGLLEPDEPRYAAIGREMARSGDWVTPRLWGEVWFEKPPLLYWMTAAGNLAGLDADLAPRLPVALLSAAFILFYVWILSGEFGARAACFAGMILATSAAWVVYSRVAVTDLPMTATFSAAMLLGLRWMTDGGKWFLWGAAFCLGLAVLAKGLVPLALSLPLFWVARYRLKELFSPVPVGIFLLAAAPWHVLCALRNGPVLLNELFWKHHFSRFWGGTDLHLQPFWYYLPVLAAGLFPWIPLLPALFSRGFYHDYRRVFLLLWLGFGFLFFSVSAGKLPGYILPLFPAMAALFGLAIDRMRNAGILLAACALLLSLAPIVAEILPSVLTVRLSRSTITGGDWRVAAFCALIGAVVWWLDGQGRRGLAMAATGAVAVAAVVYVATAGLPELDRRVSARPIWKQIAGQGSSVCLGEDLHRRWVYGLNYYAVKALPRCSVSPRPIRIEQLSPDLPPAVLLGQR
jgi:4-amino-4-deoxy-L-arabinose transferase-like glycosyltransferase